MGSKVYRPEDALLAGVCAELARRLGWNVWALRGILVLGLFLAPVPVGIGYLLGALAMSLLLGGRDPLASAEDERAGADRPLSEELGERGRRIAELERRFRELER